MAWLVWMHAKGAGERAQVILIGLGIIWAAGSAGIYAVLQVIKKRFHEKEELIASIEKGRDEYHTILRTAMDGFWQVDLEGNLLDVNDTYCQMSGYSRAELLQMNVSELDVNETEADAKEHIQKVIANATGRFESVHRRKDGSLFPVEVSVHYLKTGKLFSFLQDMTSQKHAELALRESSRRINETLQNIELIAVSLDKNGYVIFCNNFLLKLTGWNRDQLMGKNWFDTCIPRENNAEVKAIFNQFISDASIPVMFENEILTHDGRRRLVRWNNTVLRNMEGRVIGTSSIGEDITDRRQTREALRASEEKFRKAFFISPDSININRLEDGAYVTINQGFTQVMGYVPEDCIGKTSIELNIWDRSEDRQALMSGLRKNGEVNNLEARFRAKDGSIRYGLMSASLLDLDGVKHVISITRDITERKRAEEELRTSENLYRKMNENSPLGMHFYKLDGNDQLIFTGANPAADKLLGVDNSQFTGKTIEEAFPPLIQTEVPARYRDAAAKGISWSTEQIMYEDKQIQGAFEVRAFQTTPENMVAIFADITERKQAEAALQKSEALYHNLVETSQDLIWECDAEGRYAYLNPAWEQVLGYKIEEMLGKKFSDFQTPEMASRDQKEFARLLQGNSVKGFETIHISKLGREIYLVFNAKFLRDDDEKVIGTLGTAYDITERKRAENDNREKALGLEALFSISSHLRTAQTAEDMIPLVLEQIAQVLSADANALILLDEDRRNFTYKLGDGLLAANTGLQFGAEESISGQVMETLEPYVTLDFENDPLRVRSLTHSEGIGPALFVPLQSETEFVGVLLCARAKRSSTGPFTPAEINLLSAIGEMVGNALRRAKLYDDALARMQRVQALRAIDAAINANMDSVITLRVLINQILSLMKVDAAAVLLYNPLTHEIEHAASRGFKYKDIQNAGTKIKYGLANTAIIERRLVKVQNLQQVEDPNYREIALKEGFNACHIIPMIAKGQICGILEVYNRAEFSLDPEWLDFLEALSGQAAIAINNAQLFGNLEKSNLELSLAYDATIEGWSKALELKDRETEGHTLRVTAWTVEIARLAGLSASEIMHVRRGALLHDIGKMGTPDHILKKAGELTTGEWKIMRQHTENAYNMLYPISFLRPAIDIPYCHHERWDGTGYPRKLKGEQIPFVARLFAVIDVWDAVTSDRTYRKAWDFEKSFEHVKAGAGKHFDPQVVNLFVKEIDRFKKDEESK